MKFLPKEITIAIILGFLIGIVITYGVWNANRAIKQKQQVVSPIPTETTNSISPPPDSQVTIESSPSSTNLTIAQPEPHTLITTNSISLTGFTQPNNTVIIYSENDPQTIYPDSDGQFSTDVTLDTGINFISIVAITPTGEQFTASRTVTYSTTELE